MGVWFLAKSRAPAEVPLSNAEHEMPAASLFSADKLREWVEAEAIVRIHFLLLGLDETGHRRRSEDIDSDCRSVDVVRLRMGAAEVNAEPRDRA